MRIFSIALILAVTLVACSFAVVVADSSNFVFRDVISTALDVTDLCESVGEHSGCSGCVHGTKGLCSWVAIQTEAGGKRALRFRDMSVSYECVPTIDVPVLIERADPLQTFEADTLCPLDPAKEPISREYYYNAAETDSLIEPEVERTSVAHTQWHDSQLADFPTRPWPVDRTSPYGALGFFSNNVENGDFFNCGYLTSRDLIEKELEGEDASQILYGVLSSPRDKFCVRLYLSALLTSRCPAYGVAVSGVCKSFYDQINTNCFAPGDSNIGSVTSSITDDDLVFETYLVVPDSTPFCIDSFDIKPTGELEHLAGLDISFSKLEDEDEEYKYS